MSPPPINSLQAKDFLGSGIACLVTSDANGSVTLEPMALSSGSVALNALEDHVRQSILLILQTGKGERVMRPDFGAGLNQLVFEPLNQATLTLAQHNVQEALVRFEPRIEVLNIAVSANPDASNQLIINLQYRMRATDTTFNLVYPFFLERGEG